jgi:hypothetical protein
VEHAWVAARSRVGPLRRARVPRERQVEGEA